MTDPVDNTGKRPPVDYDLRRPIPRDRDTLTEFATAAYEAALHMQDAMRRLDATAAFLESAAVVHDLKSRGLEPASIRTLLNERKAEIAATKKLFDRDMFGEHNPAPTVVLAGNPLVPKE